MWLCWCRYSNPPLHGALLVSQILHDKDLKQQWYKVGVLRGGGCVRVL